jgi:oxepin-CoA hydrolase/3-oxo-5,6-dehydrosuberyl-CoA semialdehyde dehydrogenase
VKLIVESTILPKGALQLISGPARDILDHLDYRDLVAFTGSASTANRLRSHDNVMHGGVRFSSETDSLNAAILGPDAVPGTPEFEAFIRSLVTEVTVKAGQKCTGIRRTIVPKALVRDVVDAARARIQERVTLGDPRAEGVTMGALASLEQLEGVRDSVRELLSSGGEIALGSLDAPEITRADGTVGPAGDGAFMAPLLLTWEDVEAGALHSVEAFGPVASVIGYDNPAHAVHLAALGSGSLVATVCTNDPETARELVTGIAAHHGRVLILNREDARSSTGHGSPVPHLTHGGPGRAGGGEELGGMRSVLHHMQRTALQGSPNMLTAVTGIWHTGADRRFDGGHPFRKNLAELRIGDAVRSDLREVTLEDITAFADTTGDQFYAHTNEEAAAANPFFPGIVAHGYLLLSWAAGLFVEPEPGPVLANYGLENLRFLTPVAAGDSIRVTLTAKKITPRETDEYGEVAWDAVLTNQSDEVVATYDVPDPGREVGPGARFPADRTRPAGQGRWCSPSKTMVMTSSASLSAVSWPPGLYHSTIELMVPKSSRVVVRGSMSLRSDPSERAASTSAATCRSKERRRSSAPRSTSVFPRRRRSRVTNGSRSVSTATVPRSTNSSRASARPEVARGSVRTDSRPPRACSRASRRRSPFEGTWW